MQTQLSRRSCTRSAKKEQQQQQQQPQQQQQLQLACANSLLLSALSLSLSHLDTSSATAATPAAKRLVLRFRRGISKMFFFLCVSVSFEFYLSTREQERARKRASEALTRGPRFFCNSRRMQKAAARREGERRREAPLHCFFHSSPSRRFCFLSMDIFQSAGET